MTKNIKWCNHQVKSKNISPKPYLHKYTSYYLTLKTLLEFRDLLFLNKEVYVSN